MTLTRALLAARRVTEATPEQIVATGALAGSYGRDPVDGDTGFRPAGQQGRQVPYWTLERARAYSVAAYRANPMAKAIIDTYTSFCVGDSGVSLQVTNPQVAQVANGFWGDPRNRVGARQELLLRDHLLMGETLLEMIVGQVGGMVRYSVVDTSRVDDVTLVAGNPLWPDSVLVRGVDAAGGLFPLKVVDVDDVTGLRDGRAQWWISNQALLTDKRGMPFLTPVLDWLDSYDTVLSNLIDRTALARYLVWDVTVNGRQRDVDDFVEARGGRGVPPSGSVEVHNENVKWEPKTAPTGAMEDSIAGSNVLTLIAGGSGLSKTWLAEPDGANRATSLTMAEPVRRRVGGIQKTWLGNQTEFARFAVDRAVAARRLPATVEATDPKTGSTFAMPASQAVQVTGPEIAAADAQITAAVLLNLSTGLQNMVGIGALSQEGARVAARKAWEDYVGVPYTPDLDSPDANPDDVATAVDDAKGRPPLKAVQGGVR